MSFVCDDHDFSCQINDEASICTAELLAIEAAIDYIWESSDEEFMVITDSLSSLQFFILHMCHYLSGHKDIVFCWVDPIIKRSGKPIERRRDDIVLCRARIGHAYFTNGYLLRGELRPMCCNTRLTVRHVLLGCAKYAHIRRKHVSFNSLFELFRDTPASFIIQLRECNLYYMF